MYQGLLTRKNFGIKFYHVFGILGNYNINGFIWGLNRETLPWRIWCKTLDSGVNSNSDRTKINSNKGTEVLYTIAENKNENWPPKISWWDTFGMHVTVWKHDSRFYQHAVYAAVLHMKRC